MRVPPKIPGWTLWNELRKQRLPFCCLQMCCFSPKLMRWVMWIMNFGMMIKTSLRIIMYHIFSIICVVALIFEYGYARHPSMTQWNLQSAPLNHDSRMIKSTHPCTSTGDCVAPTCSSGNICGISLTSNNPASTPCILGVPIWSCSWGSQNKKNIDTVFFVLSQRHPKARCCLCPHVCFWSWYLPIPANEDKKTARRLVQPSHTKISKESNALDRQKVFSFDMRCIYGGLYR